MSDFVSHDILPDLWEEILKRHWTFLETEENVQKLEEQKKLEGCLKEFLSIVPHDRKFFLPETTHVLRKSIREMDDFSAYKAIIGFEAISQYANNLFTKPWRKEYRVLKKYSGFFQHEINSNLLDTEKLFEAMGYRIVSDDVMVLDGPICPDQVTNVSRDAMAAYVECQIIKNVYAGMVAMGFPCTWQDVFNFREKYVGGISQTFKGLAHVQKECRSGVEKLENSQRSVMCIPEATKALAANNFTECPNCGPIHNVQQKSQSKLLQDQWSIHSNTCSLHQNRLHSNFARSKRNIGNNKLIASYPSGTYQQQSHVPPSTQSQMSHSRSLEHYNVSHIPPLQRHSFDQRPQGCNKHYYPSPQNIYESPYDCLDGISIGDSSVSYAAVPGSSTNYNANGTYSSPYNVSGNRYPLPYNISNQMNSQYTASTVTCNGVQNTDFCNSIDNSYNMGSKPYNCNYRIQQPSHLRTIDPTIDKSFQMMRNPQSFPPEQLIDFDDRACLTNHDFHEHIHTLAQLESFDSEGDYMFDQQRHGRGTFSCDNGQTTYAQPKDMFYQHSKAMPTMQISTTEKMYGDHVYACPVPRGIRGKGSINSTEKFFKNSNVFKNCDDNNRNVRTELEMPSGTNGTITKKHSRDSYDPLLDNFVNVGISERPQQIVSSQASKNQDGVGSFESWDFVFQNLEKSGYSKDLGERGDLLVQSLNLDPLILGCNTSSNNAEIKIVKNIEEKHPREVIDSEKLKVEKPKQERSILKHQNNNGSLTKKPKSALKSVTDNKTSLYVNNGNVSNLTKESKETADCVTLAVAKQAKIPSPIEWSCRFCTFLNPYTNRICEMCYRSKDFNIEATVSKTPTCV